jgi:glucose-1-phosphate cytidylyltransferase
VDFKIDREIPVVILAGGLGTRLREETEFVPKPMVKIGKYPIIWHIMKSYSHYGFNNFIVCTGYKGEVIQDYFLNFYARNSTFTVNLGNRNEITFYNQNFLSWKITVVNTGEQTPTGGRLMQIKDFIEKNQFMCTYGDGLSNVNIDKLLYFHNKKSKLGTLTSVRPESRFGTLVLDDNESVVSFQEKPIQDVWINGGFFVFEKKIFEYLKIDTSLEQDVLKKLAISNELNAFKHTDFWQPMDTFREFEYLNKLWHNKTAPWAVWSE